MRDVRVMAGWGLAVVGLALGAAGCATEPKGPGLSEVIADAEARAARARALFADAERARAAGQADAAIDLYRQSLALKPDAPEPWNNLGVLLMDRREYLDAAEAFRNALTYSRPEDSRAAENLGLVYHRAGWGEESLKYYEEALRRAPHSTEALRGAIKAARLLNIADERALERVRNGLLVESDPVWHEFYLREKFRIEERLRVAAEG